MLIKNTIKSLTVTAALSVPVMASAASFNFAAIADGDSSYGFTGGEFGAPSITFVKDGITLEAQGFDTNTGARYNAYLDSSGGAPEAGLGVCKDLDSNNQCTPSSDDNVTINENLMLTFDTQVIITETTFRSGLHTTVFDPNATFDLVIDRGLVSESSDSFLLEHIFSMGLTGTTFEFMNLNTVDADDFRFYISSMEVSAVPVPAAVWLFGSGLLGLAGLARRKQS